MKLFKTWRVGVVGWLIAVAAWPALALPPGVKATVSLAGFEEFQLDNGLKVVLKQQTDIPGAILNIVYRVGSRDEGPGTTGHAHLLEHMLFKGCGDVADVKVAMKSRGVLANATTQYDVTEYHGQTPDAADSLLWLIGLQAKCMRDARFTEADLASEMTVVRNEFERSQSNTSTTLYHAIRATAFRFHPYGRPVGGQQKDIEQVDFAQLRGMYQRYYRPDNAVLTIVGRFDADAVLTQIARTFGFVARPASAIPASQFHEPAQFGERETVEYRVGGGYSVALAYHIPEGRHPDSQALVVLAQMLGRSQQAVTPRAMKELKLNPTIGFAVDRLRDPGLFILFASGESNVWQLRDHLTNHLQVNLADKLTDEDLQTVKSSIDQDYQRALQRSGEVTGMLTKAIAQGDWRLMFTVHDGFRSVKLADVKRVAETYLVKFNRSASVLHYLGANMAVEWDPPPSIEKQLAAITPRQAASSAQAIGSDPVALDQRTKRWSPRPGWQVAWLNKALPNDMIKLTLTFRFAAADDRKGHFGTSLIGRLLQEGSADMVADEMSNRLSAMRCDVEFSASDQHLVVGLNCPGDKIAEALQWVGRAVRQPRWDIAAFERERSKLVANVPEIGTDAAASNAVMMARVRNVAGAWSKGDPQYGWVGREAKEAWKRVALDELKSYYQQVWGGAGLQVAAMGALDPAALESAITQAFGTWQAGRPFVRDVPKHIPISGQRHHARIVDRLNGTVSATQFLALSRNHADQWPMALAAHMFASPMGSRLWQRWREKQGICYDVQGALDVPLWGDWAEFRISASYAAKAQDQLLQGLEEEAQRVRDEGFTQEELDRAKAYLLSQSQSMLSNDELLPYMLRSQLELGIGFDDIPRQIQLIKEVTLTQANESFRRYIKPQGWVVVTVANIGTDEGLGQSR